MSPSRRDMLLAGGGALGLALLGAGASVIFKPNREPTPYDDLLALLSSREDAARAGTLMAEEIQVDAATLAKELRTRLNGLSLAQVSLNELDQSQIRIVEGWVLPDSLALLCALAARI